jgi:tetratricopeptide (TPR) repeat protein
MRKNNLIIWIVCLFACLHATAQDDATTLLSEAGEAYEAKSYDEAIKRYEQILKKGEHSVTVYNNLGSSHYQKGDFAYAVLYFEKGLKLNPFNKSILFNLNLAQEALDNDIVKIPEFFLSRIWKYMYSRLGSNTWFILSLLSLGACVYALGLWLLGAQRKTKKKGFIAGLSLLALAILTFFLSQSRANFQHSTDTAIVLPSDTPLKSAPEEANDPIMILEPGVKLFILDEIGEYKKVKLENGQIGWVLHGSYLPI